MIETSMVCCTVGCAAGSAGAKCGVLGWPQRILHVVEQHHTWNSTVSSFWRVRVGFVHARSRGVFDGGRRTNVRQNLDWDHAASMANGTFPQRAAREPLIAITGSFCERETG